MNRRNFLVTSALLTFPALALSDKSGKLTTKVSDPTTFDIVVNTELMKKDEGTDIFWIYVKEIRKRYKQKFGEKCEFPSDSAIGTKLMANCGSNHSIAGLAYVAFPSPKHFTFRFKRDVFGHETIDILTDIEYHQILWYRMTEVK